MSIDVDHPIPAWLREVAREQPYPLIFATVSGAHLYGFASADSDVDLRGVHRLPVTEVAGLRHGPDTIQHSGVVAGVELDVVTHDLAKFCRLLMRPNGYVLEQLHSPLVVQTSAYHDELVALAPRCLTRHHARHYLGFAANQWRILERTDQIKPALYTLRVLLTGIHLMRTGTVVADIRLLWPDNGLPYVADLLAAKRGSERARLGDIVDRATLAADVTRLRTQLADAAASSHLPERATAHDSLHDLVLRARLAEPQL